MMMRSCSHEEGRPPQDIFGLGEAGEGLVRCGVVVHFADDD